MDGTGPIDRSVSDIVRRWTEPVDRWLPLLAGSVAFSVYWRTMAPTVYGGDSAELTTGAYVLGIVHAPGSPLYLLLAHAFTWLPIGDVGYRVNLLSACSAAIAIGFVCAIVLRLTRQPLVSLGTAWLLGFSYYFWIMAVAAELYALHACFIASLIWLALCWREQQRRWQLCACAALFGLGLGNHLSLALLFPGFVWLLTWERGRIWRRPAWLAAALLCGLLGTSVYLYLPIRSHTTPMNFARASGIDVGTLGGFWWMISCRMFAAQLFAVPPRRLPLEFERYAYQLWSNFVGLGCILGAVGLVIDFRRRAALHTGLLLMLLGHLAFMLTYDVPDKELMLGPTYLIWALWVPFGAQALAREIGRWRRNAAPISAGVVLMLMSAGNLLVNFGYADIGGDWSARRRGEMIFAGLPSHAVYVGTWADVPIMEYLQLVEQVRLDVETVNLFFISPDRRSHLALQYVNSGKTLFTSVPDSLESAGLQSEYNDTCGCYQIGTKRRSSGPHITTG